MNMKETSKEIHTGITVHRTQRGDIEEFTIQNKLPNTLDFQIDFSDSSGIDLIGTDKFQINQEIPPMMSSHIVSICKSPSCSLRIYYSFSLKPIAPWIAQDAIEEEEGKIRSELMAVSDVLDQISVDTCKISYLKSQLSVFINPNFPPLGGNNIHWRRSSQFFGGKSSLFPINPYTIRPGLLGNTGFLNAISVLSERPSLLRRLFLDSDTSLGIFRVKLSIGGEWTVVTLDDYFPCYPLAGPVYSRSDEGELWLLALEKAYASVYGGYSSIESGSIIDSFLDLTGCPSILYDLESPEGEKMVHSYELWHTLKQHFNENSLMSASLNENAHCILKIHEAYGYKLLKLRQREGFSWQGDWSNESPLWSPEDKAMLSPGTFWMAYEDLCKHASDIAVCRAQKFFEARLRGKFVRIKLDNRDKAISRWYYSFDVSQHTLIHVGLHQEDPRFPCVDSHRPRVDLGICIMRRTSDSVPRLYHYVTTQLARQAQLTVELEPGSYVIVPRTSGCFFPEPNYENKSPVVEDGQLTALALGTLREVFKKYDVTMTGDLAYPEFKALMECVHLDLTLSDFEDIKKKHPSSDNGLTFQGWCNYVRELTILKGPDYTRSMLSKLGYDYCLKSVKAKPFVMTVHSNCFLGIAVRDAVGSALDHMCTLEMLRALGVKKNKDFECDLMVMKETDYLTFGIFNHKESAISATLVFRTLRGTKISHKAQQFDVTVPPGGGTVVVHVIRVDSDCQVQYDFSYT